jgi:hypothetical protein
VKPITPITVFLKLTGAETVIARSAVATSDRCGYLSTSSYGVLKRLISPVRTASVSGIGFQSGIRRYGSTELLGYP